METVTNTTIDMETISRYMAKFMTWTWGVLPKLILAIIILVLGWILATILTRVLRSAMRRSKMEKSVTSFLCSLIGISLKVFVVLCTLSTLGLNVSSMIAAIGAAGVAAGLAVKDTLANLAAGISIVFYKPFVIGDFLEFQDISGVVEKTEMMTTSILTLDNKTVIVPNSMLTANYVINYTKQGYRRLDLSVPIDYSNDIEEVKDNIMYVIKNEEKIIMPEQSIITLMDYDEYSVTLGVMVWCKNEDFMTLKSDMKEKIFKMFTKDKILRPNQSIDINISKPHIQQP